MTYDQLLALITRYEGRTLSRVLKLIFYNNRSGDFAWNIFRNLPDILILNENCVEKSMCIHCYKDGYLTEIKEYLPLDGIQSVNVASKSPLNNLLSCSIKIREAIFAQVVRVVISENFLAYLKQHIGDDLNIQCVEEGFDKFRWIRMNFTREGQILTTIIFDGWSGEITTKKGELIALGQGDINQVLSPAVVEEVQLYIFEKVLA